MHYRKIRSFCCRVKITEHQAKIRISAITKCTSLTLYIRSRRNFPSKTKSNDGLNKDLERICIASNCSANISLESIPQNSELKEACAQNNWDIYDLLLTGGEDYILIFTADSTNIQKIEHSYLSEFKKPFYKIGKITSKQVDSSIYYSLYNKPFTNKYKNFEHF